MVFRHGGGSCHFPDEVEEDHDQGGDQVEDHDVLEEPEVAVAVDEEKAADQVSGGLEPFMGDQLDGGDGDPVDGEDAEEFGEVVVSDPARGQEAVFSSVQAEGAGSKEAGGREEDGVSESSLEEYAGVAGDDEQDGDPAEAFNGAVSGLRGGRGGLLFFHVDGRCWSQSIFYPLVFGLFLRCRGAEPAGRAVFLGCHGMCAGAGVLKESGAFEEFGAQDGNPVFLEAGQEVRGHGGCGRAGEEDQAGGVEAADLVFVEAEGAAEIMDPFGFDFVFFCQESLLAAENAVGPAVGVSEDDHGDLFDVVVGGFGCDGTGDPVGGFFGAAFLFMSECVDGFAVEEAVPCSAPGVGVDAAEGAESGGLFDVLFAADAVDEEDAEEVEEGVEQDAEDEAGDEGGLADGGLVAEGVGVVDQGVSCLAAGPVVAEDLFDAAVDDDFVYAGFFLCGEEVVGFFKVVGAGDHAVVGVVLEGAGVEVVDGGDGAGHFLELVCACGLFNLGFGGLELVGEGFFNGFEVLRAAEDEGDAEALAGGLFLGDDVVLEEEDVEELLEVADFSVEAQGFGDFMKEVVVVEEPGVHVGGDEGCGLALFGGFHVEEHVEAGLVFGVDAHEEGFVVVVLHVLVLIVVGEGAEEDAFGGDALEVEGSVGTGADGEVGFGACEGGSSGFGVCCVSLVVFLPGVRFFVFEAVGVFHFFFGLCEGFFIAFVDGEEEGFVDVSLVAFVLVLLRQGCPDGVLFTLGLDRGVVGADVDDVFEAGQKDGKDEAGGDDGSPLLGEAPEEVCDDDLALLDNPVFVHLRFSSWFLFFFSFLGFLILLFLLGFLFLVFIWWKLCCLFAGALLPFEGRWGLRGEFLGWRLLVFSLPGLIAIVCDLVLVSQQNCPQ